MGVAEKVPDLKPGHLANNGMLVQGLQKVLTNSSETNIEALVKGFLTIARVGAWRAFAFQDYPGHVFRWNAAEFRTFLTADRPASWNTCCAAPTPGRRTSN